LRILHIAGDFFPDYLGTTIRLYNLLSDLSDEILIYALKTEAKSEDRQQFSNIAVRRVTANFGGLFNHIPYFSHLWSVRQLYRAYQQSLLNEKFDIVHGHTPLKYGIVAEKVAEAHHKPFVYEAHGLNIDYFRTIFSRMNPLYPSGYIYVKMREQELLESSVHIICLTRSQKARIRSVFGIPDKKMTVIPNGVDIDRFSPAAIGGNKKELLGIKGKVVMYAGYLDKVNGMADFAWLVPRALKQNRGITFVFIGRGPEERKVKELCRIYPDNVRFLDMVPYDEMPLYYKISDVFMIPRRSSMSAEMLTPLKLLEIMAMERCVLGSDVGGIAEVVTSGHNGYLFRKDNLEDMERTLLSILESDTASIGRQARITVANNYSWHKSRQALSQIYRDVT
jgi:glycosyltransferase involved in cell wall biosynthesis